MENESCNTDEYILKDQLYSIVLAGSFNDVNQKIQALQWPIKVCQTKKNRDCNVETFEVASDIKMLVTNGRIEFRTKQQTNIPAISSIIKTLAEGILELNQGIKCVGFNSVKDFYFQDEENNNIFLNRFFQNTCLGIPVVSVSYMDEFNSTPVRPKRQYTIIKTNVVYAISTDQFVPVYRIAQNYHFDIQAMAELEFLLACSSDHINSLVMEFQQCVTNE